MAMPKICQIAFLLVAGFSAISSLAETSKRRDGAATVRVGILSDTHIGTDSRGTQLRRLERAYRLFKSHGVAAIINLGDIANDFRQDYYESYRKVSREIFPGGIDETFVYHGHDMFVRDPKKGRVNLKTDEAFGRVAELLGDPHGQYRAFELAGIPFLSYPLGVDPDRIEREVTETEKKYPDAPVFVLHHVPCVYTSAGSQAAGLADRKLREIMNRHPRAVVLSGHVHGSIAHEGKIWQDEFTAVGFGDFKNPVAPGAGFHVAVMELGRKRAVLRRYDIDSGREIRPEEPWTLDFPYDPARPRYRSDVRVKTTPEPAFSPGAKVSAEFSGDDGALTVRFPAAADPQWVESYTVSITRRGEDIAASFAVLDVGAGVYAVAAEKRPREFKAVFDPAYFAENGKFTVYVKPKGYWGNYGREISADCESKAAKSTRWRRVFSATAQEAGEMALGKHLLREGVITSAKDRRYRVVIDAESSAGEKDGVGFSIWGAGGGSIARGSMGFGSYSLRRYVFVFKGTSRTCRWFAGVGPAGKVKVKNFYIDIDE